jgi:outer membrane protein assembly factor BamA
MLVPLLTAIACFLCFVHPARAEAPLIVQDIECRGNVRTACAFIRDRLYLSVGGHVDEEEISNAVLRLSSLPNFTAVKIYLEKGSERGRALVVIEVAESDAIAVESAFGVSARFSGLRQSIAGRISNDNLFGAGKVLSLQVAESSWISGIDGRNFGARLLYADPRLLDSKKYFLIGGLSYANNYYDESGLPGGNQRLEAEHFGIDLAIGRRIFNFSYVTLGYQALPLSTFYHRSLYANGLYNVDTTVPRGIVFADYGWNSEDDPYFPTRGSRLNIHDGYDPKERFHYFDIGYRKTWKIGTDSTFALKFGVAPGSQYRSSLDEGLLYAFTYARNLSVQGSSGAIQRGRWYVEPGIGPAGIRQDGTQQTEYGLKVGVLLETKTFGLINIFAIGSETK